MKGRNLLLEAAVGLFAGAVVLALVAGALIGGALMWWVR